MLRFHVGDSRLSGEIAAASEPGDSEVTFC